jgi:hypothetical protein
VLDLSFIFIVVLFYLVVILWAGTLGLQGLIYNEPAPALHWRAPVAGAALAAFVGAWCFLSYSMYSSELSANPNQAQLPLDTIFRFQPVRTRLVDKLWSVQDEKEIPFKKRDTGPHGVEYRDAKTNAPWKRSDPSGIVKAIIVEDENGQKMRFEPRLTREGNFVAPEAFPTYYEVGGRHYMDTLGRVSLFHRSLWFLNILFNIALFGVWFVCLWLVLNYQWPHALGLAVVLWVVMILIVMPMLFDRVRETASRRAVSSPRVELRWDARASRVA